MKYGTSVCGFIAVLLAGATFMTVGCHDGPLGLWDDDDNEIEWTFDTEALGGVPADWQVAETRSAGTPATWKIIEETSPDGASPAVAITENTNRGRTFNLLIAKGTEFKDLELEVQVKALTGKQDQGGGPIWRARDADNYYIARWNPLENNFRLYVVKDGRRRQLASADVQTDAKAWHKIEITHVGNHIIAAFDDKKLLEVDDETFPSAGMVGLWTKADAATAFDNLEAEAAEGQ